jgi:hypothetical protein
LLQLAICARSFGVVLDLKDLDLSIFQDAIITATSSDMLQEYSPDAVAYLSEMMSPEQKDWRGFELWHRTMMDYAVFGSEENPINVDK